MIKKISIEEIIKKNKEAGRHWFSPETLQFFNSRVSNWALKKGKKAYFLSSEQRDKDWAHREWPMLFDEGEGKGQEGALFTIREADLETGQIKTVGKFQEFDTITKAKKKLKELIE